VPASTPATAIGNEGPGEAYEQVGHKWFTSAPMCDAFLVLAQTQSGLSCFLVPRWRPDGSKNPIQVQRLKNKMGNVSNASSEIELRGALGWLVGEEGRGVPAIIEMVAMTRFDCMIGSASGQRQAVAQAVNHAAGRAAFGKTLLDQPLMRNVLADLQLEVEGSLAIAMRMGEALDQSTLDPGNTHEALLLRLGLPAGKYWICKRTPFHAYEAMECLGGNGVTEGQDTGGAGYLVYGTGQDAGSDARLDKAVEALKREFSDMEEAEYRARHIVDRVSLTMQASQLVAAGNTAVAEAFIASRLGEHGDRNYGTLPRGLDLDEVLKRANPWEGN